MHAALAKRPTALPKAAADLAAKLGEAHRGFLQCFANALDHALTAGRILNEVKTKKLVAHGQFADFQCASGVGDRQCRRYAEFAQLHDASNRTFKSGFPPGTSIEGAIRLLKGVAPAPQQARQEVEPIAAASGKPAVAESRRGAAQTKLNKTDGNDTEKTATANAAQSRSSVSKIPQAAKEPASTEPHSDLGTMVRIFLKVWRTLSLAERWRAFEEIGAADFVAALPSRMRAEVLERLRARPKKISMENVGGTYEMPPRASQH